MGAVCGIMITASHNPACDNGIKIFAEDGFKLPDSVELEIEKEMLEGTLAEEGVPCENIGKAYRIRGCARPLYRVCERLHSESEPARAPDRA